MSAKPDVPTIVCQWHALNEWMVFSDSQTPEKAMESLPDLKPKNVVQYKLHIKESKGHM